MTRLTISVVLGLSALATAGIGLAATNTASARHPGSTAASAIEPGTADHAAAVTRTSGVSRVQSDSPPDPVLLRSCPHTNPVGVQSGECSIADRLASGDTVQMRCWIDTSAPSDDSRTSSPRWFFVNEVNGPHPGYSGFIYSAEVPVGEQIRTPLCTQQIYGTYQDPAYHAPTPPHFQVVGTCTTAGGTLTSVSSGFAPGAEYSISAAYPDGTPYRLAFPTGTTRADGSVAWRWPCKGDPPGIYSTTLVDEGTGDSVGPVFFTIGSAGSTSATDPGTPAPANPVATSPSTTSTGTTSAPALYTEQEGHHGVSTFTNPHNASGPGPRIAPAQYVQVSCKVHDPAIASANPDGYWYRIAGPPWNDRYYAPANTFMNGDPWGGPYSHNTDWNVPNC